MFILSWKSQQAIDRFLKKWIIYIGNCHSERFVDVYFVLEISTSYWSILEEIAGLRDLSMSLEEMIHLYRKLPARQIRRCRLKEITRLYRKLPARKIPRCLFKKWFVYIENCQPERFVDVVLKKKWYVYIGNKGWAQIRFVVCWLTDTQMWRIVRGKTAGPRDSSMSL